MIKKETSIYENLLLNLPANKKEVAFTYEFKKFSYKHMLDLINTFSFNLKKKGIKKGDVVTLCLVNIPSTVYLLFAINQIGAKANLIHPLMQKEMILKLMKQLNSSFLFVLENRFNELNSLTKENICITYLSPVKELNLVKKRYYYLKNKKYANDDYLYKKGSYKAYEKEYKEDSFFLHSGGTSGESKIISLSNYSINSLIENIPYIIDFKICKKIKMSSFLPIFHGFGLALGLIAPLMYKGSCALIPKFRTKIVLKNIKRKNINILIGVPTVYEALLKNKSFDGKMLRNLYISFVGGDFSSKSLFKRFNELMIKNKSNCRLFEGYGLTETVTVCSVNSFQFNKEMSVGKIFPNIKIKIKDLNSNTYLPINCIGEICVGGETLMNKYMFSSTDSFVYIDNEKYVKTGDVGYIDQDNFLFLKSRIKRLIKIKGINIFPYDIESIVNEEKEVENCVVLEMKNEHSSYIKLFIVLKKEYKNVNIDSKLKKKIKEQLGVYSVPKEIKYVDEFKRTIVGKIDYKNLT